MFLCGSKITYSLCPFPNKIKLPNCSFAVCRGNRAAESMYWKDSDGGRLPWYPTVHSKQKPSFPRALVSVHIPECVKWIPYSIRHFHGRLLYVHRKHDCIKRFCWAFHKNGILLLRQNQHPASDSFVVVVTGEARVVTMAIMCTQKVVVLSSGKQHWSRSEGARFWSNLSS